MDLVAAGTPAATVAPKIQERQTTLDRIEARLRIQRPAPNIESVRAALEQRAEQWKADLRAELQVARQVLRRVIGPARTSRLGAWRDLRSRLDS